MGELGQAGACLVEVKRAGHRRPPLFGQRSLDAAVQLQLSGGRQRVQLRHNLAPAGQSDPVGVQPQIQFWRSAEADLAAGSQGQGVQLDFRLLERNTLRRQAGFGCHHQRRGLGFAKLIAKRKRAVRGFDCCGEGQIVQPALSPERHRSRSLSPQFRREIGGQRAKAQ